jgi:cytochrome c
MLNRAAAVTVLAMISPATAAAEQDMAVERGRVFAERNCARCHATGPIGESPLPNAPSFRSLHLRYPVDHLVEALAEGIRTAHRAMPEFELDQAQIDGLTAYLKPLEQ